MLQRPEMPGRALKLVSRLSGLGTGGRVENHRRTMRWRRFECGGFFGDAVRGEGARGWRQSTRGYRWDVSRYRVSFVMMSLFAPSETRSQCRLGSGCAGVDMEMDDLLFCRKNRLSRTFGGPPWSPCSSLQPVSLIVQPPLLLKMVRASNARAISWHQRIQWTKSTDVSPRGGQLSGPSPGVDSTGPGFGPARLVPESSISRPTSRSNPPSHARNKPSRHPLALLLATFNTWTQARQQSQESRSKPQKRRRYAS